MKYYFIINGRKDKTALVPEIKRQVEECSSLLEENGDTYDLYVTMGEGDATREVHLYSDLHPAEKVCFVACGGDGTVNEVASGMVGFPNKSLAILALYGNCDFIKYYPDRQFQSFREILKGENCQIDIIKANDSYAINVCGMGFDSVVASAASFYTEENATNVFRKGVAKGILFGRWNRLNVVVDGEKIGHRYLLLCTLANSKYVGGEFCCAPRAVIDDGLIEVCYLRPMSFISFLCMLSVYKKGEHLQNKFLKHKIIYRRAKHVEVSSSRMIELCLDGELLPGTHFSIDILHEAITLRLPKKI